MNRSALIPGSRLRYGAVAAVVLVAGACTMDRISSPAALGDGRQISLEGNATLLLATTSGVQTHQLGRWQSTGTVHKGVALSKNGRPVQTLDHRAASGASEAAARHAAASLLRILHVRDDVPRSEPGRVFARSSKHGADEITTGLLIGESGLPETIVVFRNDEPVTLFRYRYARERAGWRATAAAAVMLEAKQPRLTLVATSDRSDIAAAELGSEVLRAAGSMVATVQQSVIWKRIADAIVPPLHAEEEDKCWRERVNYGLASAALVTAAAAVHLACGTMSPACVAALAAYYKALEWWTNALNELYRCYGYQIGGGGGGSGDALFVYWHLPTRSSIEEQIKYLDQNIPTMEM